MEYHIDAHKSVSASAEASQKNEHYQSALW